MNLSDLSMIDAIGGLVGLVLTLFVFSYIFGDNFLFRLAIHIFIGVSAGIVAVVVGVNVIWPQLISPLLFSNPAEKLMLVVPLLLSLLLIAKISPRFAQLGNPVLGYLVGVGAAAAIGGSVLGTVFPQVGASINYLDLGAASLGGENIGLRFINGSIVLVGVLSTLIYFNFGARSNALGVPEQPFWLRGISWVGQAFIAVTFGALFAGVYAASLTALIERWDFILQFFNQIFQLFT